MTDIVRDPNSLTKDKLKKELMKRNVTLPTSEKRKDVYVQLYREHVLSNLASFSSDEEDTFGGAKVSQRKSKPGSPRKSVSQKASGTSASIDPMKLTDEELAAELRNRGVDVGPILDTTRKVYQKKLDKLLKEAPVKSEPVIQVEEEEEEEEEEDYSDEEVQTQVKQVIQTKVESVRKRQVRDSPKPPSRTGTPRKTTRIEPEKPATNEVNDVIQEKPKKLTPPPQRISTTTRNTIPTKSTDTSAAAKPPQKRAFSIKVQLAILVIVAIVIFFVITKMEPAFSNHIRPLVGKMGGK